MNYKKASNYLKYPKYFYKDENGEVQFKGLEGCKGCEIESAPQEQVCEVCKRLDKDESIKFCFFCQMCNAWICLDDVENYIRRGLAVLR